MRLLRRCPRPCLLGADHGGRCWPPQVGGYIIVGLVVVAALVAGFTHQDVVVEVLGDPLSRLVMLALGVEACVLVWGPAYAKAWRALTGRLRR